MDIAYLATVIFMYVTFVFSRVTGKPHFVRENIKMVM